MNPHGSWPLEHIHLTSYTWCHGQPPPMMRHENDTPQRTRSVASMTRASSSPATGRRHTSQISLIHATAVAMLAHGCTASSPASLAGGGVVGGIICIGTASTPGSTYLRSAGALRERSAAVPNPPKLDGRRSLKGMKRHSLASPAALLLLARCEAGEEVSFHLDVASSRRARPRSEGVAGLFRREAAGVGGRRRGVASSTESAPSRTTGSGEASRKASCPALELQRSALGELAVLHRGALGELAKLSASPKNCSVSALGLGPRRLGLGR